MEEIINIIALQLNELKESMWKIESHLANISESLKNAPSSATNTGQGNEPDNHD